MAWGVYARHNLAEMGFGRRWERAYLELDEFELLLGSMSFIHFGARFPCFSREEPIPRDWWNLRLHLYAGQKIVRPAQLVRSYARREALRHCHNSTDEPVSESTINLRYLPPFYRGLLAAVPYLPASRSLHCLISHHLVSACLIRLPCLSTYHLVSARLIRLPCLSSNHLVSARLIRLPCLSTYHRELPYASIMLNRRPQKARYGCGFVFMFVEMCVLCSLRCTCSVTT